MAGQGIWSGTVSFSLVAIPVRLVAAVSPGRVHFRTLHAVDFSPLERRMLCPEHGTIVPPGEIVKGYELAPGHYLPLTGEELDSVSPERSRTIEIFEFIDLEEVEPVFFERPYYLTPLKGGEKSYRLLAEVMRRANRAGLARLVLAEREHLVAVASRGEALAVFTLRYGGEVVPAGEGGGRELSQELKARMKGEIEGMLSEFDPGGYADARRERLLALLARKAEVRPPVSAPEPAQGDAGPPDLMAALKEAMRTPGEKR